MKTFSIYLKVLLLGIGFSVHTLQAIACGWDLTDNYYIFYAFNGDRTATESIRTRLTEWWTTYAGTTITTDDLDALSEEEPSMLQRSKNPIVRAAYNKGDAAMKRYLSLLIAYLQAAPNEVFDPWDYPTQEELAAQQAAFAYIAQQAAANPPKSLAPQFALLRIRALFQAGKWQEVLKTWQQSVQPLPASVFKDMATGFYAGALRKLGSDEDAAEIYASLGDLHSATWCVHDGRNIGTIRRLYKQNPNSQAVRLLVQDFVNNTQETLDNIECEGCRLGHNGYISRVYSNEVAQFVLLAEEAAQNAAVEDACMWLTAAAWVQFLTGYTANAKSLIDRAIPARGTEQMHDDARIIRLVIYSGQDQSLEDFETFALPELQWLSQKVTEDKSEEFSYYFFAAQRVLLHHLVPLYLSHHRETDALLCMAKAERLYGTDEEADLTPHQVLYHYDYTTELIYMKSAELLQLYNDLYIAQKSPLRQWLYDELNPALKQAELYYDLIGTTLMRENKFKEALPWLQKVSLDFLSEQDLSYYMARRDYTRERWLGKRQTLPEVRSGFGGETPTRLTQNQRLQFCHDVVKSETALAQATTAAEKAEAHYKLATLLYQGSLQGDCWYLTEYYRSCCSPNVLLDTLAYDHLAQAVNLARTAKNTDLLTRALMGKAFLCIDAKPFFTYAYDWSSEHYTLEFYPAPDNQQYHDFLALAAHVRTLPQTERPTFLSRCDVLTTWMARNP